MIRNRLREILVVLILIFSGESHILGAEIWFPESASNKSYMVVIEGEIVKGDFEKIEGTFREKGPFLIDIYLFSKGGDVLEAVRIGNLMRSLGLTTHSPDFNWEIYAEDETYEPMCTATYRVQPKNELNCGCDSSCFLIWIGGLERKGEYVGVHRPVFNESFYSSLSVPEAEEIYESMSREVRDYLNKYSIPESIISDMFATPSHEISGLSAGQIGGFPSFYEERLTAICGAPENPWELVIKAKTEELSLAERDLISRAEMIKTCRNVQFLVVDRIQSFRNVFGDEYIKKWEISLKERL